jgi:hypothetical protein
MSMSMSLKRPAMIAALFAAFVSIPGHAQAPKPDPAALARTGILERLAERSGVYGVPPTAKCPLHRRCRLAAETSP